MMLKIPVYPIVVKPLPDNYNQLITSPQTRPIGMGTAPIGASEAQFGKVLQYYFGDWVLPQQEVWFGHHYRPYTVDFAIVEPTVGLHVDVEVDEPNSFATGEPTHCVGDDDYRNACFANAGWLVVRFAEEQVVSQPLRYCRFLANAIAHFTGNNSLCTQFPGVETLTPIKQWSRGRALMLKKQRYRQAYLHNQGSH